MNLNQIYIFILLGFFLTCSSSTLLAPLYPIEAIKKGVDEDVVGFIFASHPLVAFIISLFIGQSMQTNGRKIMIIIGLIMQMIGLIGFGFVNQIQNKNLFILVSIISRLLQGVGKAYYCLPSCALIPILYKKEFEVKITYIESIEGIGLFFGYMLGSGLYALGGYYLPFIIFAILILVLAILMQKIIPTNQDISEFLILQNQQECLIDQQQSQHQQAQIQIITYKQTFKNFNILMTTFANIFPSLMLLYLEPTFAIYLDEQLGIGEDESGLFFAISCFIYFIFSPIVGHFIKQVNKKALIFSGLIGFCLSYIIIGPDPLLGISPQIWLVVLSLIILGLSASLVYPPMMPEIVDNLNEIYSNGDQEQISDFGSTIYNSTFSLGEFLGPLLSGILSETLSFPRACSLMGVICGMFGFIFIFYAGIHKTQLNRKKLENGKQKVKINNEINSQNNILENSICNNRDTNDEL